MAEVRIGGKAIRGAYLHRQGAQTRHIPWKNLTDDSHKFHGKEVSMQRRDGILGGPGGSEQIVEVR